MEKKNHETAQIGRFMHRAHPIASTRVGLHSAWVCAWWDIAGDAKKLRRQSACSFSRLLGKGKGLQDAGVQAAHSELFGGDLGHAQPIDPKRKDHISKHCIRDPFFVA